MYNDGLLESNGHKFNKMSIDRLITCVGKVYFFLHPCVGVFALWLSFLQMPYINHPKTTFLSFKNIETVGTW